MKNYYNYSEMGINFISDAYAFSHSRDIWQMRSACKECRSLAESYMVLRKKIRGRQAAERKDKLAIKFFKAVYKKLKLNPYSPEDNAFVELVTELSLSTGEPLVKPKVKDKMNKLKKYTFCYINKPRARR